MSNKNGNSGFSSSLGYVLAAADSAVGVGNICGSLTSVPKMAAACSFRSIWCWCSPSALSC